MNNIEKQKISKAEYSSVHNWLRKNFGKATNCENDECTGISSNYEWSLLHNESYERKRENFHQLCKSCHSKYDLTESGRKRIAEYATNRIWSKERNKKISDKMMGKKQNRFYRAVLELDSNREVIKEWVNFLICSQDIGASQSHIHGVCVGRLNTVYGRTLIFKDLYEQNN